MKSRWLTKWNIFPVLVALSLCHPQSGRDPAVDNRSNPSGWNDYLYVSLDAERSIAVYKIDTVKGELAFSRKFIVSGEPGSLAVDPTKSFLYAAIRSSNSISSFRINRRNGDLTPINSIRAAGNPVFVGTDRTGKFLLTAYFADSKAAIYSVREDGGLQDSAVQVLDTEKNAHAIQTDPSNRFLFIPCRTGEAIQHFRFNSENGTLSANVPDRTLTPPKTGPRHFAFHPSLNFVYFVSEFGNRVTAYRLGKEDGSLSAFQTLSSLPAEFAGASSGADIHITPDGRFLYASNRGHESIAAFSLDATSGQMTSIGVFQTEKTPRSFAIDPSGRFLYAAGQGSGQIAAYRIGGETGELIPLTIYEAGKNPVWIQTIRLSLEE